jgi:hypothetical protein
MHFRGASVPPIPILRPERPVNIETLISTCTIGSKITVCYQSELNDRLLHWPTSDLYTCIEISYMMTTNGWKLTILFSPSISWVDERLWNRHFWRVYVILFARTWYTCKGLLVLQISRDADVTVNVTAYFSSGWHIHKRWLPRNLRGQSFHK